MKGRSVTEEFLVFAFSVCACVCVCACVRLHGLSGEVLAEVPHDVEGVHGGGGEDASGRLVAQICQWVGGLAPR